MISYRALWHCAMGCFLTAVWAYGGTVSGTVKGPGGGPLQGAFVEVRNTKTKVATMGLSDKQGRYGSRICPPATIKSAR